MPKKSKRKQNHTLLLVIAAFLIVLIAWAVASAFFDLLYTFLMANPWVYLIIPAAAIVALVLRDRERKAQKAQEQQRLQQEQAMRGEHIQHMLSHREAERKTQEQGRVQAILSHKAEWGNEMCQWMIDHKINPHKPATMNVMSRYHGWGRGTCQRLLLQQVEVGMTGEMVEAAYGKPPIIDERETTARDEKYRYVYGRPRRDATYVWFKNGVVTRIKQ